MLVKTKGRIAVALLIIAPLAVGTAFEATCMETTMMALNPMGTILNIAPELWYATMVWPVINAPDYERDPSCTIPYGCGTWFGSAPSVQAVQPLDNE